MNNELKLDFIENGRMSEKEMNNIYGGGESCENKVICPEPGLSSCGKWSDCGWLSKDTCTNYKWVVMEDFTQAIK